MAAGVQGVVGVTGVVVVEVEVSALPSASHSLGEEQATVAPEARQAVARRVEGLADQGAEVVVDLEGGREADPVVVPLAQGVHREVVSVVAAAAGEEEVRLAADPRAAAQRAVVRQAVVRQVVVQQVAGLAAALEAH